MNNITIAGNCGKDAEVKRLQNGDVVAGFSVAVNEGRDKTTWFSCSLWGDRAEKLAPYIRKGSKITVSGSVSARAYDGKAYLEVRVGQVTFMSSKGDTDQSRSDDRGYSGGSSSSSRGQLPPPGGGAPAGGYRDMDDDIPF